MTDEDREQIRREVWADVAATLNDRADMWDDEGPRRAREAAECRGLANAYRTYAEGVGIPAMSSLRAKRAAAEAEVHQVTMAAMEFAEEARRKLTASQKRAEAAEARVAVLIADQDG